MVWQKLTNHRRGKTVLTVVLVIAVVIWWNEQGEIMDATTTYWFDRTARDGSLEGKTLQEIQGMLNTIVEEGMFHVSVNADVIFRNGVGSLCIENIHQNRYFCRAVLTRDEDNTILFESEGIKPGWYIDYIELKEKLPAGIYPCTVRVIVNDPDTLEEIGQVHVKITAHVMN